MQMVASNECLRAFFGHAVPLTVFFLDYCIRYPACSLQEIAQRELETVTSSGEFDTAQNVDGIYAMPSVQKYAEMSSPTGTSP